MSKEKLTLSLCEEISKWKEVAEGWKELCQDRKKQVNELKVRVTGLELAALENKPQELTSVLDSTEPKPLKTKLCGNTVNDRASPSNLLINISDFIVYGKYNRIVDIKIVHDSCALILYEEKITDATDGKG